MIPISPIVGTLVTNVPVECAAFVLGGEDECERGATRGDWGYAACESFESTPNVFGNWMGSSALVAL